MTTGSNLYSQGFGSTSSNSFPGNAIKSTRDPSPNDIRGPQGNYTVGQLWVNTVGESSFQLVALSSEDGAVFGSWIALGGGSDSLSQLSGDTGTAFPVGGNITIAGGTGISTTASGAQVTISLSGGGAPIEEIVVQTGTTPVTSSGGSITLNGATVAAGTNPVRTDGTNANTIAIEVQKSQAIASADATKIGLAAFNNSDFTVDGTGYVSAIGGGFTREVGVTAFTSPGTNPVVPNSSGLITVNGAQAAAGSISSVIQTNSLAANTYTVQIQRSQAVGSSTLADNGVCHFNSNQFTVDGAGFVSLTSEPLLTIDVQSGGDVVPDSGGTITITGSAVPADSTPIQTVNSGANSFSVAVQYAVAAASSDPDAAGLASFNSSDFTVDANGFVATSGGAFARKVSVDAATSPGTNPVLPNSSGIITVTGGQVAAGTNTNVIQTNSLADNTYTVQIQRSQAVASSTVGDNGVCHFSSADFAVDGNGFVTLSSAGAGQTLTGQAGGPISPSAGNWNIFGATSAAGTSPIATSGSGSTITATVQTSQAIASSDATKIGLSVFDSADFTVDANGFVSLSAGAGDIQTLTGTTGGAISPSSGNINLLGGTSAAGTTPVAIAGSGHTLTTNVQISQAIASADATKIGLASFNSSDFTVDSTGFVSALSSSNISSGTWSPQILFGGDDVGVTYQSQSGTYISIGVPGNGGNALIVATGYFVLSSKGSSTGVAYVGNLPFAVYSGSSTGTCSISVIQSVNVPTGYAGVSSQFAGSALAISLYSEPIGPNTSAQVLDDSAFSDTSGLTFVIIYQG